MTPIAKLIGALIVPAAALSGLGLAATGAAESGDVLPMQCQITVQKARFGHSYTGVLKSDVPVQGTYEMTLEQNSGGSARIRQAGDFSLKAGETQTLGQATLGTSNPGAVQVELLLHVGGQTLSCATKRDT